MKSKSPLITLAGLVVAFGVMLAVNLTSASPPSSYDADASSASSSNSPETGGASPSGQAESADPYEPTPSEPTPTGATSAFADEVVYAGRTKDGSAAIAVAVRGNRAAAYFCDGRSVETWFTGAVDGERIDVKGKAKAGLTATLKADTLWGSTTIGGNQYEFAIEQAEKPAGLYRAKGDKAAVGWIVLPDGSQVGILTSADGSRPAPQLTPETPDVVVGGETLQAEPITGDENF